MTRINIGRRAFLAWLARNPYGHRRGDEDFCPLAHFLAATGRPASVGFTVAILKGGASRELPRWAIDGLRRYDGGILTLGLPAKEAWK